MASLVLSASLGLGLSVMVFLCDLVFIFSVLFLCRGLATDLKKLRKTRSVKTIDDGVQRRFSRPLTFLPDVRCSTRVSRIDRIPLIDMRSEHHSLGCRDATVVTMVGVDFLRYWDGCFLVLVMGIVH